MISDADKCSYVNGIIISQGNFKYFELVGITSQKKRISVILHKNIMKYNNIDIIFLNKEGKCLKSCNLKGLGYCDTSNTLTTVELVANAS